MGLDDVMYLAKLNTTWPPQRMGSLMPVGHKMSKSRDPCRAVAWWKAIAFVLQGSLLCLNERHLPVPGCCSDRMPFGVFQGAFTIVVPESEGRGAGMSEVTLPPNIQEQPEWQQAA